MHERFWDIVHDELQRARLGMTQSCEGTIRDQIAQIVDAVGRDGWRRGQPAVEAEFRELVRAMVDDARAKGYAELHEDTFYAGRAAVGILCPGFWPFC